MTGEVLPAEVELDVRLRTSVGGPLGVNPLWAASDLESTPVLRLEEDAAPPCDPLPDFSLPGRDHETRAFAGPFGPAELDPKQLEVTRPRSCA